MVFSWKLCIKMFLEPELNRIMTLFKVTLKTLEFLALLHTIFECPHRSNSLLLYILFNTFDFILETPSIRENMFV